MLVELSIYYSDDGKRYSKVMYDTEKDMFGVEYFGLNKPQTIDYKDTYTLQMAENLAEDYVL